MSCTKSIIYKYVTQGSQFFRECFSVLCFFCAITSIFQKNYFSVLHSFHCSFCVWSNYFRISSKFNFLSQKFRQTYSHRCKRQLWFWLSLRFSQMRTKNYFSSVSNQFFDCWQRCYQTIFISNFSFLQRNVKITANQYFFSFYIDIINRFFVEHGMMPPFTLYFRNNFIFIITPIHFVVCVKKSPVQTDRTLDEPMIQN